jgi:hypothetical protein
MKAVQPDQEATKEQLHMLARGAVTELLSRGGGGSCSSRLFFSFYVGLIP